MKTNIFKDGQTIPVKLAENAAPQEAFAAAELCSYLERMTSTAVEQCGESYAGPAIAVGGAAEACGVAKPEGADSFTLKTVGESLCVTGGKRGVIYGVYEFWSGWAAGSLPPTARRCHMSRSSSWTSWTRPSAQILSTGSITITSLHSIPGSP